MKCVNNFLIIRELVSINIISVVVFFWNHFIWFCIVNDRNDDENSIYRSLIIRFHWRFSSISKHQLFNRAKNRWNSNEASWCEKQNEFLWKWVISTCKKCQSLWLFRKISTFCFRIFWTIVWWWCCCWTIKLYFQNCI